MWMPWSKRTPPPAISRFARPRLGQLAAGNRNTVVGLQVVGMTLDLVRAAVLGAVDRKSVV
jgi:hypothetical protein